MTMTFALRKPGYAEMTQMEGRRGVTATCEVCGRRVDDAVVINGLVVCEAPGPIYCAHANESPRGECDCLPHCCCRINSRMCPMLTGPEHQESMPDEITGTNRVKGLTVVLERNYREDDEIIIDAISLLRGVKVVKKIWATPDDYVIRQRTLTEIEAALMEALSTARNRGVP